MADKTTFIKIDRNIIHWRWFKSPKMLSVFLWLLIRANTKEGHFERDTIPRGSIATSNATIAEGCGITIDNVRTALANLEDTGEISRTARNHYQVIKIVNYEEYQEVHYGAMANQLCQIPSNPDGKSQANPNNIIIKEYNNKRIPPKSPTGDLTPFGDLKRGTDEFRNKSHLLLKPEEGTADDIPEKYRELCGNDFAVYWRFRNQ